MMRLAYYYVLWRIAEALLAQMPYGGWFYPYAKSPAKHRFYNWLTRKIWVPIYHDGAVKYGARYHLELGKYLKRKGEL